MKRGYTHKGIAERIGSITKVLMLIPYIYAIVCVLGGLAMPFAMDGVPLWGGLLVASLFSCVTYLIHRTPDVVSWGAKRALDKFNAPKTQNLPVTSQRRIGDDDDFEYDLSDKTKAIYDGGFKIIFAILAVAGTIIGWNKYVFLVNEEIMNYATIAGLICILYVAIPFVIIKVLLFGAWIKYGDGSDEDILPPDEQN